MRLVVLSTYDIMPVTSGGQARYLNIYNQISTQHDVTIIAYDWQAQRSKTYHINPKLRVIVPTVLAEDVAQYWEVERRTNRVTHDAQCIRRYKFSQDFHQDLQAAISGTDVVIASHPFLALVGFGYCADHMTKVYEAHNVEFDARAAYYRGASDRAVTDLLLEDVRFGERLAAHEAEYVTAASDGDADRLVELYGVSRCKITIVPNGVEVASYPALDQRDKQLIRDQLSLGSKPFGVFLGGRYMPNIEAYLRIRAMLAEAGYSGTVALIGAMKEASPNDLAPVPFDERWLGFVEEEVKTVLLSSADFALQLMFIGAGTNLKLFEYMAARTLIAANSFGTRGVAGDDWFWRVETSDDLRAFLEKEPWRTAEGEQIAARARTIVEQQFDWSVIAQVFGRILSHGSGALERPLITPPEEEVVGVAGSRRGLRL
jgi:glycosyltransferase involved in cell wall biosynthesis